MPTEASAGPSSGGLSGSVPDGRPASCSQVVRNCREILAAEDIRKALQIFTHLYPQVCCEFFDANGRLQDIGESISNQTADVRAEFTGSLWNGRCWVPTGDEHALEIWRLLMEQFDRRAAEAWTDPLTELPNRRWLEFELKQRQPRLVGFFDMIGLQQTNRDQSHAAGDQRLCAAAAALSAMAAMASEGGRAFRVGGDEFVVVLVGISANMIGEISSLSADGVPAVPEGLRGGWGQTIEQAERAMRESAPRNE